MRFYVASRFCFKNMVRVIQDKIRERGHKVSDWTHHKEIRPFDANSYLAMEYAIEDINSARECDIFILLSDGQRYGQGTGMHVELGAAIASFLDYNRPQIYVIGNHTQRSMFYYHPAVKRRDSLEEVLKEVEKH